MARVNDTKKIVDCLWKAYQYTDELTPLMEWLEDNVSKSTREINSSSAADTEEHQERQEKVLDQLDKKKSAVTTQKEKGEKILKDPKAPKFMQAQLDKLNALWTDANKCAESRLKQLKDNLVSWERYERERDALCDKLNAADTELSQTVRVYCLEKGPADATERKKTAAAMRKDIEGSFNPMKSAHETLCQLLDECKKAELDEEVANVKERLVTLENMDEKIKKLDEFNGLFKEFETQLKEFEGWLGSGRQRMDDLINPPKELDAQERVMQTMELQTDTQLQVEKFGEKMTYWDQTLAPTEALENTEDTQTFIGRLGAVHGAQASNESLCVLCVLECLSGSQGLVPVCHLLPKLLDLQLGVGLELHGLHHPLLGIQLLGWVDQVIHSLPSRSEPSFKLLELSFELLEQAIELVQFLDLFVHVFKGDQAFLDICHLFVELCLLALVQKLAEGFVSRLHGIKGSLDVLPHCRGCLFPLGRISGSLF